MQESGASLEDALAFLDRLDPPDLEGCKEYAHRLWYHTQEAGVDFALAFAQWMHETGYGTSKWWINRKNPAGLGITGTARTDNKSKVFASFDEAARAQVAHLLLHATGHVNRGGLVPEDDPRYEAYIELYGGNVVRAETIADLATRKGRLSWAADPDYAGHLVRRMIEIFTDRKPQRSFGDVAVPLVDGVAWTGSETTIINTVRFNARRMVVSTKVELNQRQYGQTSSPIVFDPIPEGVLVEVLGWVDGENIDGEDRWWITVQYARIWAGGTNEKP